LFAQKKGFRFIISETLDFAVGPAGIKLIIYITPFCC